MPRARDPFVPPGEDPLELPVTLGWFVEACTRIHHALLALRQFPPRARPPVRVSALLSP